MGERAQTGPLSGFNLGRGQLIDRKIHAGRTDGRDDDKVPALSTTA